jgi:hypothetical protein
LWLPWHTMATHRFNCNTVVAVGKHRGEQDIGQMPTDPAELILYGKMSPELFFEEAQRLGIPAGDLKDAGVHNRVLHGCLVKVRKDTAKALASDLGLPITEDQAYRIARNSLTPEVMEEPAPLGSEERAIARVLYFHAVKAAVARQGSHIKDRIARAEARRMVLAGERGLTSLQRLSRASGCLVMLGLLTLVAISALLSATVLVVLANPLA